LNIVAKEYIDAQISGEENIKIDLFDQESATKLYRLVVWENRIYY